MISPSLFRRFYPDDRRNGTRFFYNLIHATVATPCRGLNLGAGPGDIRGSETFLMRNLRSPGCIIVGCDIDYSVKNNPQVDKAVVMSSPDRVPFSDNSFDFVYSDYVLEHVEHPKVFASEVYRVLKPGGQFFLRTPNLWHYVSLIARCTPHYFHELIANRARGLVADAHDPYPTFYRMNRPRALRRLLKKAGFKSVSLTLFEAEPSYLLFSPLPFLLGVCYERLVNSTSLLSSFRMNIMGCAVK